MANRIEDEVIDFITKRRPLKLLALGIAVVGVLSSASTTLAPIVTKVQPTLYRLFHASLDDADQTKYSCAYFAGRAVGELGEADRVAVSAGARRSNIKRYMRKLFFCHAALGQMAPRIPVASNASEKDLDLAQDLLIDDIYTLSGALSKDRLAFLLNQIGRETVVLQNSVNDEVDDHERHPSDGPLSQQEAGRVLRVTRAVEEARWLCPCRLPGQELDGVSRRTLQSSVAAFDLAWEEQFPKPTQ